MKIIVSFATEEFVTPEHDDVILRLAAILRRRGITGSFHLTGDYARKLRERRRSDVITALRTATNKMDEEFQCFGIRLI